MTPSGCLIAYHPGYNQRQLFLSPWRVVRLVTSGLLRFDRFLDRPGVALTSETGWFAVITKRHAPASRTSIPSTPVKRARRSLIQLSQRSLSKLPLISRPDGSTDAHRNCASPSFPNQ